MIPVAGARRRDFEILCEFFWSYFPPGHGILVFRDATALLYFGTPRFTMLFLRTCQRTTARALGSSVLASSGGSFRPQTGHRPYLGLLLKQEVALTKISASHFASVLQAIGPPNGRRLKFLRAHYAAPVVRKNNSALRISTIRAIDSDVKSTLRVGRIADVTQPAR